jgi:hypothetical protein
MLSRVVIAGLVVGMLISLVSIVHALSGRSLIDQALAGTIGQEELLAFDTTTGILGFASLAVFLATAVVWLLWQYVLVRSIEPLTHDAPLKTPVRSVLWWFVPWLNLVAVYQIYGDLRSKLAPDAGPIVGRWWGMYLLANAFAYITGLMGRAATTPDELVNNLNIAAVGDALTIVSAVLALRLVLRLQGGQDRLIAAPPPPISINTLEQGVAPVEAAG